MQIRIVATPPGEAPLEVREKWVGLTLPVVAGHAQARSFVTSGVLTGPTSFFSVLRDLVLGRLQKSEGYVVEAATAIELLAKQHPSAAEWWKQKTPHLLQRGRRFVFQSQICEPVSDVTMVAE